MEWQEAIQKSKSGTAKRVYYIMGKSYTTIRYNDGSGFVLISKNKRVDFTNSRVATTKDLEGFTDWQPS